MRKSNLTILLLLALLFACKPLPVVENGSEDPVVENGSEDPVEDNGSEDPVEDNGGEDPVEDNGGDEEEITADALKQIAIVYFPFDDETAKSTAETQADGVLFGSPSFITDTPSGMGKALFLNGIKEQFVNIPYALFAGLKYFTISFWVKDFSAGSVVSGIYASNFNNDSWQYYPRVYFTAEGKISFSGAVTICPLLLHSLIPIPTFSLTIGITLRSPVPMAPWNYSWMEIIRTS